MISGDQLHSTGFGWVEVPSLLPPEQHRSKRSCSDFTAISAALGIEPDVLRSRLEASGFLDNRSMWVHSLIKSYGWAYTMAHPGTMFLSSKVPRRCIANIPDGLIAVRDGAIHDPKDRRGKRRRTCCGWWEPLNPPLWG